MQIDRGDMHPKQPVDARRTAEPSTQTLTDVQAGFRASFLAKLAKGEYRLENVDMCLCGCSESRAVAHHDRFGIPVGVRVCAACGLARTSPRLAADCLPAFYEDDYHGLHMGCVTPAATTALYQHGQGSAIFARIADLLPPAIRVAEIGCGTGQVLREFETAARAAGHSVECVGCEYASAFVAAGRAAGSDIRRGGPSVLAADPPFDLVILSHVVEHFANVPDELGSVSLLLRPGGLAYVEVPGVLAIHHQQQYDFEFGRYFTLAHTYHFSLGTLVDTMTRAGFEFVRGDEEARTVFRRTLSPTTRDVPPGRSDELIRYLAWLGSSPSMRARRLALRARRRLRYLARTGLERVLGPAAYRRLRDRVRRNRKAA